MLKQSSSRLLLPLLAIGVLAIGTAVPSSLQAQQAYQPLEPSVVHRVQAPAERMQMTVNTSRRLTLDGKIREVQVNNPEILEPTVLSPTEVNVSAKATGVTQVILWGEDKRVYTIDVLVHADARELALILRSQFPNASLKVIPVGGSVLISGFVDQPEHVDLIIRMAEEYYPKVINKMAVSGVQQVLLHVKVMEVSRTKLRTLGFDWAQISGSNAFVSGVSGLLGGVAPVAGAAIGLTPHPDASFAFSVVDGNNAFFGVLEALRQDNLLKILAEPDLVTVSGRPAFFNVGGEFPILVPQSLGTVSIEYKRFGTQVDFVPIVLGNGRIRLEVRPRVSEIDPTRSATYQGITVPGLRVREVDTGVEMAAGQTLAIAGLVQTRVESENRGLPWISEVPYLGAAFRTVREQNNEIELLMLVTPELVDAMDAHEVPSCGPGMRTTSPSDWELYWQGHLEVPNCCPPGGPNYPAPGQGGAAYPAASGEGLIIEQPGTARTRRPGGPVRLAAPPAQMVSAMPAGSATGGRPVVVNRQSPPAGGRPVVLRPASPQNRYTPPEPQTSPVASAPEKQNGEANFIGPIGYDVVD